MKYAATQELFAYWNSLRGARPSPLRNELDPVAMTRILPDIFLLDVDAEGNFPVRLAGTRVCELYQREIRGTSFLDLWDNENDNDLSGALGAVIDESATAVIGATGKSRRSARGEFELVLLPLAHLSGAPGRIIGSLSARPASAPYSIEPLISLSAHTIRLSWPSGRRDVAGPRDNIASEASARTVRRVGHFLVYEGGQA